MSLGSPSITWLMAFINLYLEDKTNGKGFKARNYYKIPAS